MAVGDGNVVYEGQMSGAAINAVINSASGAIIIPSSNGQRVIVIQGDA